MKLSKVFKAKTYAEAQALCPKGYRMLEIWELMKLGCEKHPIIFETEKGKWIFFYSSTVERDYVHGMYRNDDGNRVAFYDLLANSGEYGRVFFVKKVKK